MEALTINMAAPEVVSQVMGVNLRTARYWLAVVREEGRLSRPDHEPVRAMIRRHSPKEKTWLACADCTYPWPCPGVTDQINREGR